MRVFLSAAPNVRALCMPALINGFETEVQDGHKEIQVYAGTARISDYSTTVEPPLSGDDLDGVFLVGRRLPRKTYRGLPWWEVRRAEDW